MIMKGWMLNVLNFEDQYNFRWARHGECISALLECIARTSYFDAMGDIEDAG